MGITFLAKKFWMILKATHKKMFSKIPSSWKYFFTAPKPELVAEHFDKSLTLLESVTKDNLDTFDFSSVLSHLEDAYKEVQRQLPGFTFDIKQAATLELLLLTHIAAKQSAEEISQAFGAIYECIFCTKKNPQLTKAIILRTTAITFVIRVEADEKDIAVMTQLMQRSKEILDEQCEILLYQSKKPLKAADDQQSKQEHVLNLYLVIFEKEHIINIVKICDELLQTPEIARVDFLKHLNRLKEAELKMYAEVTSTEKGIEMITKIKGYIKHEISPPVSFC